MSGKSGLPTISVVTISFNQARFLERCLTSVLAQEGADIDYIVVDPGSTDGSREIIERYRHRLSHVILDPDEGPADGLNRGLAKARGDIFYYLNSDDEVAPGAFREAAAWLAAHQCVDVVYGNGVVIDEDSAVIRNVYSPAVYSPGLYVRGLAAVVQQAAFIRTDSLRAIGGFNTYNRTCWDGEAFFDLARAGSRFRRVWRFWGRFRVYPGTISTSARQKEQTDRDHQRMRETLKTSRSDLQERLITRLAWVILRVMDWRRWPSYLRGSFRPDRI